MLGIRVDPERYAALESLARRDGVAPTTMARLIFNRGLREAERELEYGP
jgi:hypothetical protein